MVVEIGHRRERHELVDALGLEVRVRRREAGEVDARHRVGRQVDEVHAADGVHEHARVVLLALALVRDGQDRARGVREDHVRQRPHRHRLEERRGRGHVAPLDRVVDEHAAVVRLHVGRRRDVQLAAADLRGRERADGPGAPRDLPLHCCRVDDRDGLLLADGVDQLLRGVVGRLLGAAEAERLAVRAADAGVADAVGHHDALLEFEPRDAACRRRVARLEHGRFCGGQRRGCEVDEHAPHIAW